MVFNGQLDPGKERDSPSVVSQKGADKLVSRSVICLKLERLGWGIGA